MGKIAKLTAEEFKKKVKSLDVGEHFDFAAEAECDGEPHNEEELLEWYGVQKIYLFDNEMCVVSKYGGTGCEAFSANDDHLTIAVDDMFRNMLWGDGVYIANEEARKQEFSVTLTSSFCIDVRGCTSCGENVLIPSSKVHELIAESEERNAVADLESKIAELKKPLNFSEEELRRMASEVIDRRDDCDLMGEIYWEIVENVIKDYSAEKTQEV